jgi:hypothetical protein
VGFGRREDRERVERLPREQRFQIRVRVGLDAGEVAQLLGGNASRGLRGRDEAGDDGTGRDEIAGDEGSEPLPRAPRTDEADAWGVQGFASSRTSR